MTSYVYLVGWIKQNLWYYGSKSGKRADPAQFWKTYFTSSADVKRLRKEIGEPDVIQIRRSFDDSYAAISYERTVIRRMGMIYKDKWLNRCAGGCLDYVKAYTKSGKAIVVERDDPRFVTNEIVHHNKNIGIFKDSNGVVKRCTPAHAKKMGYVGFTKGDQVGENNPFYGKTHSPETRKRLSAGRTGVAPWNKGKKVQYSNAWRAAIKERNFSNEKNPAHGSKWLGNTELGVKCYIKNNNTSLEEALKAKGWVEKPEKFNSLTSVTKTIQDYL